MKPIHLGSATMNITTEIVNDPYQLSYVRSLVECRNFRNIIISHDIGDIPFPIHTKYLTLSYNVKTKDHLLILRRKLINIQAHTIIINSDTNLIHYLRENTIVRGSGLFGAIIRNEHIHKLIVHYDVSRLGSGSEGVPERYRAHGNELKKKLKEEQREYMRGLITPLKKVKIRACYD